MAVICKHCFVTGRVQGVFFRRSTYQKALALGLTGWVKNLENGQVEALLCGEEKAVEEMQHWLKQGPPAALVTELAVTHVPWEEHTEFEVRP